MSALGTYANGTLSSALGMSLALRVAPAFRWLGSFVFDLDAGARVERDVFVEGTREVRRLIVVQFEAFLPGVDDHYRYALRDPRVLGGETYGTSISWLDLAGERAAAPTGEMEHTARFLESKGFVMGDRHAVVRLARIVGEDRRREILIFYHEIGGSLEGISERFERAATLTAYS